MSSEQGMALSIECQNEILAHPIMKQSIMKESIPGTIKKASHFLKFMRKVVRCIKGELKDVHEPRI